MSPADLLTHSLKERLSLLELAREQNVAPPTSWRWAMRGIGGLRLPTVMIGRKRMTTRSAFFWWCLELTRRADGEQHAAPNADDQERLEKAERQADELMNFRNNE
jgi:hypothetical protein